MWFRKAEEEPPQLEDLASVLAEGPELLPGNPSSPGRHGVSAGGAGASAQQALAASAPPPAAAAAADDPLPVSSGSALPALASPEKSNQQDAPSSAAAGSWLPSVAAWLPSRAASVAGSTQEEEEQQEQQQPTAHSSWRDYLPSTTLLPLSSLLGGSGGSSHATSLPENAAAQAAAPAAADASSHDGTGLLGWAAAAPHQLASAYHQAAHQLGSVGSTAVGASLLGATVGGICAGPLGAAAGAKSGAAWVAAGALSGAAVRRLRDGGHPAGAAAQDAPLERELQAIKASSGSGDADGAAGSRDTSAGHGRPAGDGSAAQ